MLLRTLFFLFFCALSLVTVSAQTKFEYVTGSSVSVVAPRDLAGEYADGLFEGETLLKSGKIIKWGLIYDKKQQKPMYMNFIRPEGVSFEEFEPVIQAMTIREFWVGVGRCMMQPTSNQTVSCISNLQQTALSDCIRTGTQTHCWMLGQ